jgi:hypothetical protein
MYLKICFLPYKNTFCSSIPKASGLILLGEIIHTDSGNCTKSINTINGRQNVDACNFEACNMYSNKCFKGTIHKPWLG